MGSSHSLNGANGCAALTSVVNGFIQQQGGVRGVISLFEKQGLGPAAQSWAGKGESHPISSSQIFRALGYGTLQQLGAQAGLSPDEIAAKLATVLPQAIKNATAPAASSSRTPASVRPMWLSFKSR